MSYRLLVAGQLVRSLVVTMIPPRLRLLDWRNSSVLYLRNWKYCLLHVDSVASCAITACRESGLSQFDELRTVLLPTSGTGGSTRHVNG